jgi:hypothetical protein
MDAPIKSEQPRVLIVGAGPTGLTLVSLAISNARNSSSMFRKPSAHLLIRPRPLKGMSVLFVVLRPRVGDMGDELLPTRPRPASQVVVAEGIVQDLCLVEPGGMGRGEPRTPPPPTRPEVVSCPAGGMARIAIVDQVHAPQVMMATPESLQLLDVMRRVFPLDACRFHPAAVNDQDVQDVDRPMPGVLELLLFDRARDRSTDRLAFKDLVVGDLIGADHPIAPLDQTVGVGVAPKDLLGPLLELGVQASRPPVPGPVRLQVDTMQDSAYGALADGRDDAVSDRLLGKIRTGPVGNVQAFGHGFQAGQFDDLCTLQGGKSRSGVPTAWLIRRARINPGVRSDDTCDGRSIHHTGSGRPGFVSERRRRSPTGCGLAGLDTKADSGCAQFVEGSVNRQERSRLDEVFGHAWGKLLAETRHTFQHSSTPRISGITYGQGH